MSVRPGVNRHGAVLCVVITFVISWGGVLIVTGGLKQTGGAFGTDARLPLVLSATLAGPTPAGVILTGARRGRPGIRDPWRPLLAWQEGRPCYGFALLACDAVFAAGTCGVLQVAASPQDWHDRRPLARRLA